MTDEITAYCMTCMAERTIQTVQIVLTKNGRPAANGTCPVCGTKMFKFLPSSYKAMAAPPPAVEAVPEAPVAEPVAEPAPEQPAA